jgi:anti-sigma regulatory factor (Ser/Thr protein kinase)
MTEEYVLKIPAKLEGMDVILAFVSLLLDTHGCAPKARTQLRMAVEELYVNVTLYAYPAGNGWVETWGSVENGVATIRLIDGGTPFNPLAKPDPDTLRSGEERDIGGLGIYMVKTMVDEVEYVYRDGYNQLTLRKQI